MAYSTMKKLIANENAKYEAGMISAEEYVLWKAATMNKLDVFLACNRLSENQYEELVNMFKM